MPADRTFTDCVANAEHFIAIGETTIWLRDEDASDVPWHLASVVEEGALHRLSGPASAAVIADHESGLRFRWSFDFETRDANGSGQHLFDFDRMVGAALRMPHAARVQFAELLKSKVEGGMLRVERELSEALLRQQKSLEVLRTITRAVEAEAASLSEAR